MKNGDVGAKTLTVVSQQVVDTDLAVADPTYNVPAGDELHLSHFPAAVYNTNDGNDNIEIDIDSGTSVTVAVIEYS